MRRDVTIYDIAAATGVSPSTVSRALRKHPAIHRDTRKKVLAKAQELGYQFNPFASNLRTGRTKNIGIITPRLDNFLTAAIVGGIERITCNEGYNLILFQSLDCEHKEKFAVDSLYRSRVDGIIIVGCSTDVAGCIGIISNKKKIPVVGVDSSSIHSHYNISTGTASGAKAITQHLIDAGCQRIVHVTHDIRLATYRERYNGYLSALRDGDLADSGRVIVVPENSENVSEYVSEILDMASRPDGIFFGTDMLAALAIHSLASRGIEVPGEMRIAGYGNDPVGRITHPRITTVEFSPREIGKNAASAILQLIINPDLKLADIETMPEMLIRESSLSTITIGGDLVSRSN